MFRKLRFILIFQLILVSSFTNAAPVEIKSDDITGVKTFTTHHGNENVRSYTVVEITKVDGCERGVFFNHDINSTAYSSVLTSILTSRQKLIIVADDSIKSPWGDSAFCAMTSFEIVN